MLAFENIELFQSLEYCVALRIVSGWVDGVLKQALSGVLTWVLAFSLPWWAVQFLKPSVDRGITFLSLGNDFLSDTLLQMLLLYTGLLLSEKEERFPH